MCKEVRNSGNFQDSEFNNTDVPCSDNRNRDKETSLNNRDKETSMNVSSHTLKCYVSTGYSTGGTLVTKMY
jgi:hypothetical protein